MKIAIASDHAGFACKEYIKKALSEHQVKDYGCYDTNSVDYPDTAIPACEAVADGSHDFGILVCGTGIGMSIIANKVKGIRAALCHNTDLATLTRAHNNANVLVIAGRLTAPWYAMEITKSFLAGKFEGERHQNRVNKIKQYENLTR